MDLEIVEGLRKHLSVVHHVPGRVRLKFEDALANHPWAERLPDEVRTLPGVRSIRVNILARSIVVEYDRAVIRPEWVLELFSTGSTDRIRGIVDALSAA